MSTPEQFLTCPGGFVYTIRSGDTLFALAQRFNTTVQAILAANPGLDPNRLFVGQQICIPGTPQPTCPGFIYTIQAGDTLFAIAQRFNTTVQAILAVNPGLDPNLIFVGQRICIPTGTPQPPCPGFIYTVQAGDTLTAIALRYNTTVQAILNVNPGLNPNLIFVGQQICIPTGTTPPPSTCPGFIYTIQAGDTLFALAQRYNTTVQAILAVNPGLDPNRLQIGQRICIPTTGPTPPPPTCPGFVYTIQAGDTLYALAQRYNTTVQAILAVNPGLDPNRLQIGQRICIPTGPTPPPTCPGFVYTIQAGDTLYALAQRYNTTVQAIIAANPGINPNALQIGQRICIPVPRTGVETQDDTADSMEAPPSSAE